MHGIVFIFIDVRLAITLTPDAILHVIRHVLPAFASGTLLLVDSLLNEYLPFSVDLDAL